MSQPRPTYQTTFSPEELRDLVRETLILMAERDSWRRIAKSAMRALRSKDLAAGEILQPEGIWILRKDSQTFVEAFDGGDETFPEEVPPEDSVLPSWVFATTPPPQRPPNYVTPYVFPELKFGDDLERQEVWEIAGYWDEYKPFRRTFPPEILLLIASECDKPTLGNLAQANFYCLQLFEPWLHERIEFRTTWLDSRSPLRKLFPHRITPSSSRLSSHLNLQNIRILELESYTLMDRGNRPSSPSPFSTSRLQPRVNDLIGDVPGSLHLDSLTIFFDSAELYQGACGSFDTFKPDPTLLSLLNPTKLIAGVVPGKRFEDNAYVGNFAVLLTRSAATVISSWSRLESVVLRSIDLFCTEDDECWVDPDEIEDERVFFLGLGGTVPVVSSSVQVEWHLVETWPTSSAEGDLRRRALGGPGNGGWANALQAFALRDDALVRLGGGERRKCVLHLSEFRSEAAWDVLQQEWERLGEPLKSSVELVGARPVPYRGFGRFIRLDVGFWL